MFSLRVDYDGQLASWQVSLEYEGATPSLNSVVPVCRRYRMRYIKRRDVYEIQQDVRIKCYRRQVITGLNVAYPTCTQWEMVAMANWVEVLQADQLDESKGTTVFVNERDIALYRYQGDFYALDNQCVHRDGQLGDGHMDGANVICPLHQWDYDVHTGVSRYNPGEKVAVYPARQVNGRVEIDSDAVPPKPRFKSEYLGLWARRTDPLEGEMHDIHSYSRGSHEFVEPMGSEKRDYAGFSDLYFLPGQLAVLPLLDHEQVDSETIIGARRARPLKLRAPIFVSHMSFGALSKEAKLSLAMGSAEFGTLMCSGEGGMLPEARAAAGQYIFEMASGYFGWKEENIVKADGIEIKMGQSAKAGLGGLLPRAQGHGRYRYGTRTDGRSRSAQSGAFPRYQQRGRYARTDSLDSLD